MGKLTTLVLNFEAADFEAAIAAYNEEEKQRKARYPFPYKAKQIKLISKEKRKDWNEESEFNFYDITFTYANPEALFEFGKMVAVERAGRMFLGAYGHAEKEPPG